MQKFELLIPYAGRTHACTTAQQQYDRDQRLRAQARQRQRHRIGQRQRPADAGDLPHGHPRLGQEPVPVEHPGPAHLVRDPRQQGRPHRARARLRPDGRDERARPTRATSKEVRSGGYAALRLDLAARPRRCIRDDVTFLGVPLAKMCNEIFAEPRERILMKNIAYAGALVALLDIDMEVIDAAARGEVRRQEGAARIEPQGAARSATTTRSEHFDCPLPFRLEKMDATERQDPDRRQHRDRARLRLRGRDRGRLVSDHAVDVA